MTDVGIARLESLWPNGPLLLLAAVPAIAVVLLAMFLSLVFTVLTYRGRYLGPILRRRLGTLLIFAVVAALPYLIFFWPGIQSAPYVLLWFLDTPHWALLPIFERFVGPVHPTSEYFVFVFSFPFVGWFSLLYLLLLARGVVGAWVGDD